MLDKVTSADLVLTVNRRLATYLRNHYDQKQTASGLFAWPSLQILPLNRWAEQAYENLGDSRLVLTDAQELYIWEQIIQESQLGEGLLNHYATAKLVKDAWKLLQQWRLATNEIFHPSIDVQTFIQWTESFRQKCVQNKWLTRSEIFTLLGNKLDEVAIPSKIFLIGFDDFTPAIKYLISCLEKHCVVEVISQERTCIGETTQIAFESSEEEILQMACWSYQQLINTPTATVGCVLPNLSKMRNEVMRVFEEVFYAEKLHETFSSLPFNISAANSLASFPIIAIALLILKLNHLEINTQDFSSLLRSPFLSGGEFELSARSQLDVKLHILGEEKLQLEKIFFLDCPELKCCSLLENSLRNFIIINQTLKKSHSLQEWAAFFTQQLRAMGWPGERTLNSSEYQLVERFKLLFDEFITFGFIKQKWTLTQALDLFQKLAAAALFQPKSVDKPIQILGILEAAGIQFDYLWIAGLDNETWPAAPSPNPFIPIEIQQHHHMPHASSERELAFSKALMQRLQQSAKKGVYSYARFDGDRPLAPSTLIHSFPTNEIDLPPYQSIELQLYKTKNIEYFVDNYGPALTQSNSIHGGSWIFKAQAACPFRAFAKFRLHADALQPIQSGLAYHERGILVHEILADIWLSIKNHQTLCQYEQQELDELIFTHVSNALLKLQQKKPFTIKPRFLALEQKRLQNIILQWLNLEKLRQPFEVIGCETWQTTKISNLEIHVQIDRIDELADKTHVIIDYKTGRPSILDWFGERPNEPQLPLYATISEHPFSGILFGQVRPDKASFKGLTAYKDIVPGAVGLDSLRFEEFKNWEELKRYWQTILENLANDFSTGVATANPKNTQSTCQYCDLQVLCRINQIQKKYIARNNE